MSCFPLWHASQSHRHQSAWDLLQGKNFRVEDSLWQFSDRNVSHDIVQSFLITEPCTNIAKAASTYLRNSVTLPQTIEHRLYVLSGIKTACVRERHICYIETFNYWIIYILYLSVSSLVSSIQYFSIQFKFLFKILKVQVKLKGLFVLHGWNVP